MSRVRLLAALVIVVALLGPAAAAQTYPPPTPVPPFGSPSPYPTALETPSPSAEPPHVAAAAAILQDLDTGQVLFALHPDARRPVASLTKIMTALVVLEGTDVGERVVASGEAAAQRGAELGLEPGEGLPVEELLFALMLQSANDAAVALAEHVAGSVEEFVERMNARAADLGLADTYFRSPNGLDDRGYSTARDLAALTRHAIEDPTFRRVVATRSRDIPAPDGSARHVQNRNALLWLYPGATGVKTGFTTPAGFSLLAAAKRDGERLLAVVLGGPEPVWDSAAALLDYGFFAFERREVVRDGERFRARAGERRLTLEAASSLEALVHVDADPGRTVRLDRGAAATADVGDEIGEVVVRMRGRELGRVPLVVRSVFTPAPPPAPGVWARVLQAAAALLLHLVGALAR